eukprot:21905_1
MTIYYSHTRDLPPPPARSPPCPPDRSARASLVADLSSVPWDVTKHYALTHWHNFRTANVLKDIGKLRNYVMDIWTPTQIRVANFSTANRSIADELVFKCNANQIQCHGRFVRAYYQKQPVIAGDVHCTMYYVTILNINNRLNNKHIKLWLSKIAPVTQGTISDPVLGLQLKCSRTLRCKRIKPDKYICLLQFDNHNKCFRDQLFAQFGAKFRIWSINKNNIDALSCHLNQVEQKQLEMEDNKNDKTLQSPELLHMLQLQQLQIQKQQQKIISLQNMNQSMQSQINNMTVMTNQSMAVHTRYNELFVKYAVLKRDKVYDGTYCTQWMLWTWEDVLVWILNLDNGRYVKYKNHMIPNMCTHNISGLSLIKMTCEHWNRVGVTDVSDQALLIHHIQKLIALKNRIRHQSQPFSQEGQPNDY